MSRHTRAQLRHNGESQNGLRRRSPGGSHAEAALSLLVLTGLVLAAPARGELVAERLTVDNAATPTGGSLIDLALVGHDNDPLSQLFTVGGLSTENFIAYDEIRAEVHRYHFPLHRIRIAAEAVEAARERLGF